MFGGTGNRATLSYFLEKVIDHDSSILLGTGRKRKKGYSLGTLFQTQPGTPKYFRPQFLEHVLNRCVSEEKVDPITGAPVPWAAIIGSIGGWMCFLKREEVPTTVGWILFVSIRGWVVFFWIWFL